MNSYLSKTVAWVFLIAASAGVAIMSIGIYCLNPLHTSWVFNSLDDAVHFEGWVFFRSDLWHFPVGSIRTMLWPIGTGVGFTDSIPLAAIPLKAIASGISSDFQYVGPWLLACFILNGVFGFLILRPRAQLAAACVGALFFCATPILLFRIVHPSLCAHWVLLAPFYLWERNDNRVWPWVSLNIVTSTIHPYLLAMVLTLTLTRCLVIARVKWMTALEIVVGSIGGPLLAMWIVGYFDGTASDIGGFGGFSADLATFVNSQNVFGWLPSHAVQPGQGEGFGYLGVGVLALSAIVLVRVAAKDARERVWQSVRILGIPCAVASILFVYALSNHVTLLGHQLFAIPLHSKLLIRLTETFRASGRFMWPLHYAIIVVVISSIVTLFRPATAIALLTIALVAQVLEPTPFRNAILAGHQASAYHSDDRLSALIAAHRHVVVYPLFTFPNYCRQTDYDSTEIERLGIQAAHAGATINSAYLARYPVSAIQGECAVLEARIAQNDLDPESLYLFGHSFADVAQKTGAYCREFAPWIACSTNPRADTLMR